MFLYSHDGYNDKAYYIIPDEDGSDIQHQYGCVSCLQFHIKGRVQIVEKDLADQLDRLMGCNPASAELIEMKTGLLVREVLGESLIKLEDGRFIATYNCD